ncbi:MAG: hypothetical protein A2932_02045 [Candidatus Spechtbacteria bacterium RIFCSPLOWO2_01_FULL_46_10]|uniref:Uncharacterized protein n=1 Tax=Candidatus Spechtbacteria bacterium RIFCSPLOWO2_01_FULL_46_10 TaxID=1802163 RepID=A0A1G2HFK5_9BACT|nr:MAG: hypothetical protein A2932_02045 [Candidatus Spechtbacteria bacterium RIFCSPLOWO2_01_FULL_46_10]
MRSNKIEDPRFQTKSKILMKSGKLSSVRRLALSEVEVSYPSGFSWGAFLVPTQGRGENRPNYFKDRPPDIMNFVINRGRVSIYGIFQNKKLLIITRTRRMIFIIRVLFLTE